MTTLSNTYHEEQSYSSDNNNQRLSTSRDESIYLINFTIEELMEHFEGKGINVK